MKPYVYASRPAWGVGPSKPLYTTSIRRFASSFLASEKGPSQTVMSDPLWLIQGNALQKKMLQTKFVSIVNAWSPSPRLCRRLIEKTTSDTFQLFGLIMSTSTNFEDSRNYCCKIPSDMMWEAQDISKYNIIEISISISMLSRRPGQHENLQEMIGDGNQWYSEINGNHSSYKFENQEMDRFQVCLTRDGRPHPKNSESLIKGLWVAACEPSSRRSPGRSSEST